MINGNKWHVNIAMVIPHTCTFPDIFPSPLVMAKVNDRLITLVTPAIPVANLSLHLGNLIEFIYGIKAVNIRQSSCKFLLAISSSTFNGQRIVHSSVFVVNCINKECNITT